METRITAEELEDYVQDFEDMTYDSRLLAERDRDYYDHIQLTAEEISILEKRKQPTSIYNRIRPKINTLMGMERSTRTDPKATPRTPKHEKEADTATQAIRFVCDNNNFDVVSSEVFESFCVEGTGACDVYAKQTKKGVEIVTKSIPWDRLIYDPHSRCHHFSDARYMGIAIWMDHAEAVEKYPDQDELLTANVNISSGDTLEDKPTFWTDSKRKRVRIIQMYFQDNGWHYCEFTKGGFLVEPQPSPYLDEDGDPTCPIIAVSANIDRQGNRFGEARSYIGQQDEINKRRNKALHLLSQRQTFSTQGMVDDVRGLKRELAKPDGHLEFNHGEFGKNFGIIPTSDFAQGNLALLQDAKQEIDAQGANAALAGKAEGSMSGRALQARQQGGSMEVAPLLDRHKQWKKKVYKAIWNRIRQFWQDEKWIRVTDDEQTSWVSMNRRITRGMVLQQQGVPIPPFAAQDPRLNEVVGIENNVAELDVDIIIDESPDVVTLQHEEFQQIAELYRANPQMIPFDLVIEASSLRNKQKLLERIRGQDDQSKARMQQQQQKQQQMEQIALAEKQADIAGKQADAQKKVADAEKTKVETLETVEDAKLKHQERLHKKMMMNGPPLGGLF